MIARLSIWVLAAMVMMGLAGGLLTASARDSEDLAAKREEDSIVLVAAEEDDDDDDSNDVAGGTDSRSGFTSGVDSNDRTNSRHTGVSRDRDRSRGDLTRDRTKDGPGGKKRDWSKNHTNDRSRNDTR
jgi:hypothetical protein